jgi:hypothetical protein
MPAARSQSATPQQHAPVEETEASNITTQSHVGVSDRRTLGSSACARLLM